MSSSLSLAAENSEEPIFLFSLFLSLQFSCCERGPEFAKSPTATDRGSPSVPFSNPGDPAGKTPTTAAPYLRRRDQEEAPRPVRSWESTRPPPPRATASDRRRRHQGGDRRRPRPSTSGRSATLGCHSHRLVLLPIAATPRRQPGVPTPPSEWGDHPLAGARAAMPPAPLWPMP